MRQIILFVFGLFIFSSQQLYAQCTSDAGSMTTQTLLACADETVTAQHNMDEVLDSNDVIEYVLHDSPNANLGVVFASSPVPSFAMQAGMIHGETYYISAIVGDSDPAGRVNLTDTCLSVAVGTPVIFYSPLAGIISGENLSCLQSTATLVASVTGGLPPYEFVWSNGLTGPNTTVDLPGTYVVTVTDLLDCEIVLAFTVAFDGQGPEITLTQTPIDCENGTPGLIAASVNPPDAELIWEGPNGFTSTDITISVTDPTGEYCLTATDPNSGCYTQECIIVEGSGAPVTRIDTTFCSSLDSLVTQDTVLYGYGTYFFNYPWNGNCDSLVIVTISPTQSSFVSVVETACVGDTFQFFTIDITQTGTYTYLKTSSTGCDTIYFLEIQFENCTKITGHVLLDNNNDCLPDSADLPLQNWWVQASDSSQTFFGITNANGHYSIGVTPGEYQVKAIPPNPYMRPCEDSIAVSVAFKEEKEVDFAVEKLADCPYMQVNIATPLLRRCFQNTYVVSYCNNGTRMAEQAEITVLFDDLIEFVSSPLPYSSPQTGTYIFTIDSIEVGECASFPIITRVSCEAELRQTLCAEAYIYTVSSCAQPAPEWSGASLFVGGDCINGEPRFIIKNIGSGDMLESKSFIVIEDGVMMMSAPDAVLLPSGDSIIVPLETSQATRVLQISQVEGHPEFSSMPTSFIEGCGGTLSAGWVLPFPFDDNAPQVDVHCREVIGAWDPNDKRGFPIGYGPERYIEPGQQLDYIIRFQNTGNDTAFNVLVQDVLPTELDLASMRLGASSHPYRLEVLGKDTLHFYFDDILLPDSNVNEPASHGFVQFLILPRADLELGTAFENDAEIFFDFNEAVITEPATHTIEENFILVRIEQIKRPDIQLHFFPNPATTYLNIQLEGQGLGEADLQLMDIQGRTVANWQFHGNTYTIENLPKTAGIYFFTLRLDGEHVASGKVIIR